MFPAGWDGLRKVYLSLRSGVTVRSVQAGDTHAPVVLLFPGWGCSVYVFRENLEAIAKAGFRAIAVDLKGHGLSAKPTAEREYDFDAMVTHVSEIAEAVSDTPMVVGGLSMGASLAAHLAAREPAKVRGLILVSPVGFSGVGGLGLLLLASPAVITPVLPRLAGRAVTRLLLFMVAGKLRRFTTRDLDEYWAPTQFPEFVIALRHLLHRFRWNTGFPQFAVPSVVFTGTRDRFIQRVDREKYREAARRVHWIEITDAGHVVLDEAPQTVNRTVIDFLRGL